jgi:cathepsin H
MLFLSKVNLFPWLVLLSAVAGAAATTGLDKHKHHRLKERHFFDAWADRHHKSYRTEEEAQRRFVIWKDNVDHVHAHNQAYEMGYTLYSKTILDSPFADLTDHEFVALYLMEPQDCSATTHKSSGRLRPANEKTVYLLNEKFAIDWRTKGIMTPIKDQGHCGSCWTFSTSGCLEAHTCLAAGKDCTSWKGLSEEQLVECAGAFDNHGCNGGLPSHAFEYLKYSGGMMTEDDYPYTAPENGGTDTCSLDKRSRSTSWKAPVSEVFNITSRDEDDLVHAIATIGPVSIAYQVSPDFRFYQHGIYDSYNVTTNQTMCHSGNHDVNHAVVAVGLGTSVDKETKIATDYYIVRNSWSANWGMEGHFWIKRGENLCGLSDCASFPIVPASNTGNDHWKEFGVKDMSNLESGAALRGSMQ